MLKVKPVSKLENKFGFTQLGVELYGGGLWHTWFDRDLSVAGRAFVKNADGEYRSTLVDLESPICRIPTLAIHLDRGVNTDGFKFNMETQLLPILSTAASIAAEGGEKKEAESDMQKFHNSVLMTKVASKLGCNVKDVVDVELCLYDTQPAQVGGLTNDLLFSRALDNLMMSFLSIAALCDVTAGDGQLDDVDQIWAVGLFDNEEVGSDSLMGAGSNMLEKTMLRVEDSHESLDAAIANSIFVSADMAHSIHPNYAGKHEENHKPMMNCGLVIKHNGMQRYATSMSSQLAMFEIAKKYDIPTQKVRRRVTYLYVTDS